MSRQISIYCTKCGMQIEGADNVGSRYSNAVSTKRDFLRVAEHWWNTYCQKVEEQHIAGGDVR